MKRLALTALLSQAILWVRQLLFEKRIARRQGRWEREATRGITGIFERQVGEIEGIFASWKKQVDENFRTVSRW